MDAPLGYSWKRFHMRHGRRYPVGPWKEIVFVSADMHGAEFKVLVKNGDTATNAVAPKDQKR